MARLSRLTDLSREVLRLVNCSPRTVAARSPRWHCAPTDPPNRSRFRSNCRDGVHFPRKCLPHRNCCADWPSSVRRWQSHQEVPAAARRPARMKSLVQRMCLSAVCRYLHSEALRREINEGLDVIEHWNSANDFISSPAAANSPAIAVRTTKSACSLCIFFKIAWSISTPLCSNRCWPSHRGQES